MLYHTTRCCIPTVVIIDSILEYLILIHYLDIPMLGFISRKRQGQVSILIGLQEPGVFYTEQIPKEGFIQYA